MTTEAMFVGPGAKFFEDFREGEEFYTQGRTITPADGLFWAMFTGDMNPMHVDDDFATQYGLFGGKFPPGLMSVAIASGLDERLGLNAGTGLAMLEQTIRYKKPVLFGDTIRVRVTIARLEPHPTKPRGTVYFHYEIIKADGTVAIEGDWVRLVASRKSQAS
ncbi:MAG: dehydratase [Chloroflexota bacterium]|nr:MAG: dehydratase [Chloroflexota bacterium]